MLVYQISGVGELPAPQQPKDMRVVHLASGPPLAEETTAPRKPRSLVGKKHLHGDRQIQVHMPGKINAGAGTPGSEQAWFAVAGCAQTLAQLVSPGAFLVEPRGILGAWPGHTLIFLLGPIPG